MYLAGYLWRMLGVCWCVFGSRFGYDSAFLRLARTCLESNLQDIIVPPVNVPQDTRRNFPLLCTGMVKTTTKMVANCQWWCSKRPQSWDAKCTWNDCKGCKECKSKWLLCNSADKGSMTWMRHTTMLLLCSWSNCQQTGCDHSWCWELNYDNDSFYEMHPCLVERACQQNPFQNVQN